MKMFNVKRLIGALVACGLALAVTAAPAQAAFVLHVQDNFGNFVDNVDNNPYTSGGAVVGTPGGDLNPLAGIIGWSGNVGTWISQFDAGYSKPFVPFPPNPQNSELDLSWTGISTGPGTLTITLYDTGYFAGNGSPGTLSEQIGGVNAASITTVGQGWKDANNGTVPCAPSATCFTPGPLGPFGGTFAGGASVGHGSLANPYSMLLRVVLTSTAGGAYSGDAHLNNTAVPEPGSMVLLGTGLIALGRSARRRFGKK